MSIDVDTVSYSNARRSITSSQLPSKGAKGKDANGCRAEFIGMVESASLPAK